MLQAQFQFHEDLNDFLSAGKKDTAIPCTFNGDQSVKHLIEALGVPHTEVGCIRANGRAVDFGYLANDGDLIEVFPSDPAEMQALEEEALRFVLDNHLGRLAFYLRMLGFDALYRNDYQDEELALISSQERRILLTRDKRLLMRNLVQRGYWVRSKSPRQQLMELIQRYNLARFVSPFRRCMRCNGLLEPVPKEAVLDRLESLTRRYFDEFRICRECDQVYWRGSHYERMSRFIEQVLAGGSDPSR